MAELWCENPSGTGSVYVETTAPGEYAGQTLYCDLGNSDEVGDPIFEAYTFAEPEPEVPAEPPATASPLAQRVIVFLGQTGNDAFIPQANEHVAVVTAMVQEYTRGRGFDSDGTPAASVQAVIVGATSRLMANPEQLPYQVGNVAIRGAFEGWSPIERTLLNGYRKTTAG